MPTARTDLELRLLAALKRIAAYDPPERLKRQAPGDYGLDGAEAVEMAYGNVLVEAKQAVRGVRVEKAS